MKSDEKLHRRGSVVRKRKTHADDIDDKWTAKIHPSTKSAFRAVFTQYENDGKIDSEQLHTIIGNMSEIRDNEGLFHQPGLILSRVSDRMSTDKLMSYHDCLVHIGKAIDGEKKTHMDLNADGGAKSAAVKYLPTAQYIAHVISCARSPPQTVVRWQGLPPVNPKLSLLLIVVFMCTVLALSTVGLLNWVNVTAVTSIAEESQDIDLIAFAEFAKELRPKARETFLKELSSAAKNLASPLRLTFDRAAEGMNNYQLHAAMQQIQLIETRERQFLAQAQLELINTLTDIRLSQAAVDMSSVELVAAVQRIAGHGRFPVVIDLNSPGTTPLFQPPAWSSSCPSCAMNFTSVSSLRARSLAVGVAQTGVENTSFVGLATVYSACMKIDAGIGICLIASIEAIGQKLANATSAALRRAAHYSSNMTGNLYGDIIEAAVDFGSGYRMFPQPINQQLSPLVNAALSQSNTSGLLWNIRYQGKVLSGAFAKTTLPITRQQWLVCQVKNASFLNDELPRRLPAVLTNFTSQATIRVAIRSGVEQIVLGEARTREPNVSPHIRLGLSGYSGALFARGENGEEVIAGFCALTGYNAAVIIELPMAVVDNLVMAILQRVIEQVTAGLDNDRTVALIGRNGTGQMIFLSPSTQVGNEVPRMVVNCFSDHLAYQLRNSGSSIDLGDHIAGKCKYFQNPHAVILSTRNRRRVSDRLWTFVGYGLAIGLSCALVSLLITRLLTRNVLDHIERDYVAYKQQIEAEKQQFSELVKDVMPSYISEKIMAGEKLIVEHHTQLTFMFSDIVGFTDRTRNMSTVEMVRLLGYTFMMEDGVAEYYGIHKIKTIGDGYFAVAGLEDSLERQNNEKAATLAEAAEEPPKGDTGDSDDGKKEVKEETHKAVAVNGKKRDDQIYRMTAFAVVVQQLLSGSYVHYPEKTDCFLQSAGEDLGQLKMLKIKMGIHSGPAIAGVVDVGRAPHFDCFGPSVNLASRMESTAPQDRIQLSGVTANLLNSKPEYSGVFDFEAPRKTLVKGYGTMMTYIIKATTLQVPEEIIEKLHIDRAVRRQYFGESGLQIGDGGEVSVGSRSNMSQSDLGSVASGEGGGQRRRSADRRESKSSASEAEEAPRNQAQPSALLPSAPPTFDRPVQDAPVSAPPPAATTTSPKAPPIPTTLAMPMPMLPTYTQPSPGGRQALTQPVDISQFSSLAPPPPPPF